MRGGGREGRKRVSRRKGGEEKGKERVEYHYNNQIPT